MLRDLEGPAVNLNPVSTASALRVFFPHLLSLLIPLNALAFVLTGPHPGWIAPLFAAPIFGATWLDGRAGTETRPPAMNAPRWPFDALLVVLSAMQLTNVLLLGAMMKEQSMFSVDVLASAVVVGSSSAYAGIVVAHELIHRSSSAWRSLGRLLLCSVFYEHFYTEHVRGHHARVGTAADPATARFGETFTQFYMRTVPAQFRSAWRLETTRLGNPDMPWYDPRLLRSRVVQGVIVQSAICALIGTFFGPAAVVAHLGQAWWATRALEVVNYFEHWGIQRSHRRVLPTDSWDTDARFTYYALIGLARHADHHAFAARPYQQLRAWHQSPKLPRGYLAMFPLVLMHNRRFQKLMTAELKRLNLGPFAHTDAERSAHICVTRELAS